MLPATSFFVCFSLKAFPAFQVMSYLQVGFNEWDDVKFLIANFINLLKY